MRAHAFGHPDNDFKIASYPRDLTGLLEHLKIAAGVGKCSRLFISGGRGENNLGQYGGFCQEEFLNHNKDIL